MPNPRARRTPALLLAAVAASVVALVAPTLSTPADAATTAGRVGVTHTKHTQQQPDRHWSRAVRAKHALARVRKTFAPETPAAERPDATLVLRNLYMLRDALSPADRAEADNYYKRPGTRPKSTGCPPQRCSGETAEVGDANLLLHYDPSELGYDVNQAFAQLQYVANTYAAGGYRRPKSDGQKGGDGRIDIYISQLEPGLYGYCTSDQRKLTKPGHFDVWAYCVLDADYAGFPRTPLENFEVTIAHEYYHATQFAYDIGEDGWLLESTAVVMEDELYDNVNDNYQYLSDSPITKPGRPIDKFGGVFHYGVWNFFRFLIEHIPAKKGPLPKLLLDIWKAADSSKGPRKDLYSTQAVDKALKKDGHTSLAEQFGLYSAATRYTHQVFSEGAELNYPTKSLAGQTSMSAGKQKRYRTRLDHLTSATYQFVPGGGTHKLKVRLMMAPKSTGSRAVATIVGTDGSLVFKTIKVNRRGVANKKIPFDASVAAVEITLVNAGTDYRDCYRRPNSPYACMGIPVDDNESDRLQAKAT